MRKESYVISTSADIVTIARILMVASTVGVQYVKNLLAHFA